MTSITSFVKQVRNIMRNDAGVNGDAQRIEQLAWMLFLKIYDTREEDWELDDENYRSIIPEECRWRHWAHDRGDGKALTGDDLLNFVNNTLFAKLKKLPVSPDTPNRGLLVRAVFEDANNYMKDGVALRQVVNVIDDIDLTDTETSHAFGDIYESILKEIQSAGAAGEFYTPRAVTRFMAHMIRPAVGEVMADFACGTGGFLTSWLAELTPQIKTTEDREKAGKSIYGMEKKQFPYMLCVTNLLLHGMDSPRLVHGNSLTQKNLLDYTEKDSFDVILMNPPYGGSEQEGVQSFFPSDMQSSETADLFVALILHRLKRGGRAAVILPDGFLFGTDGAKLAIKKELMEKTHLHTIIRMPGSVFAPYTSITTNILFFDKTGATEATWFYRMDMPEGYKHFSKTKPIRLDHFAKAMAWWEEREEIKDDGDTWKARRYTAEEIKAGGYNLDLCGYPVERKEVLTPEETIAAFTEKRSEWERVMDRHLAAIRALLEEDHGN